MTAGGYCAGVDAGRMEGTIANYNLRPSVHSQAVAQAEQQKQDQQDV